MLFACSAKFVETVFDESYLLHRWQDLPRLVRSYPAVFKKHAEAQLFEAHPQVDENAQVYMDFFLNDDKEFLLRALQCLWDGTISDQRWALWLYESNWKAIRNALNLLNRVLKRPGPYNDRTLAMNVRDTVQLGFDFFERTPDDKTSLNATRDGAKLWIIALDG